MNTRVKYRSDPPNSELYGTITKLGDGWRVVTWDDKHEATRLSYDDAKRLLEAVNV
jgi:hypothetical protein